MTVQPVSDKSALFLTVLPNGLADNKIRLTVMLTPSVTGNLYNSPFGNWPEKVGVPSWILTFQPLDPPTITNPAPVLANPPAASFTVAAALEGTPRGLDDALWTAIFGLNRAALARTGNTDCFMRRGAFSPAQHARPKSPANPTQSRPSNV